ncbi:unnamed protein product [Durusdinium trenchii]|uniref:Uncharacterized protein n=1 Tax=Durusdinium trenchii TaxID=1381693 RepID=A0ABP0RHF6_9DINO
MAHLQMWFAACVLATPTWTLRTLGSYSEFCTKYGRQHVDQQDYTMRQELYRQRVAAVQEINGHQTLPWKASVNAFADFTREEFSQLLGHRRGPAQSQSFLQLSASSEGAFEGKLRSLTEGILRIVGLHTPAGLPSSVDWRSLNTSEFHKVQGACGSCWAVAAVGALEMHAEIQAKRTPEELSVKQLLDCVPNPRHCGGRGGCEGASAELAFQFVSQHGLTSAETTAAQNLCASPPAPYLRVEGFGRLRSNHLRSILEALTTRGPLVVGVDASHWDLYGQGVFDACERDATINHAVLLLGYGQEALGLPFWRVRNSWGKDWGEAGYMRLLRHDADSGAEGFCGVDRSPQEGVWCEGEQQQVPVCGMCGILSDATYPEQVTLAASSRDSLP